MSGTAGTTSGGRGSRAGAQYIRRALRLGRLLAHAVLDPDPDAAGAAPAPAPPVATWCWRCGATMAAEGVTDTGCAFCRGQPIPWHRVIRLGGYEGALRERILAMKLGGRWRDGLAMGRELAAVVGEPLPHHEPVVVAVPMHWARRTVRGYNQAQLLAQGLAAARGWRCVPLLRRRRWTPSLTSVSHSARAAHVRDSFALAPVDLRGRHVFLVDDIKTTGATAVPCARLLRDAGAGCITLTVAAVADPRGAAFGRL